VRETLDRANRTLNSIDYQALKPDSRANYDNAKSFIKQAEDALKANNLVVAKLLAERAENIAKQLS
jgi:cellobiose-specific phosphotransferase system component IIA